MDIRSINMPELNPETELAEEDEEGSGLVEQGAASDVVAAGG